MNVVRIYLNKNSRSVIARSFGLNTRFKGSTKQTKNRRAIHIIKTHTVKTLEITQYTLRGWKN